MSRLGPSRAWHPVNPLEALLGKDPAHPPKIAIIAARLADIIAAAGGHLERWNIAAIVHATKTQACMEAARALVDIIPNVFCSLGYRRQETPGHLLHLTNDVAMILEQTQADLVLTQPYEGGDCDRDAVAFAVHHAVATMPDPPLIVEMTGWDALDGIRSLGEFLHRPGLSERSSPLTPDEEARKAAMLSVFSELRGKTQAMDLHVEYFRMAPRYDFTCPPHPGPLWYEQAGGRWTGEAWRSRAAEVVPQLRARSGARASK